MPPNKPKGPDSTDGEGGSSSDEVFVKGLVHAAAEEGPHTFASLEVADAVQEADEGPSDMILQVQINVEKLNEPSIESSSPESTVGKSRPLVAAALHSGLLSELSKMQGRPISNVCHLLMGTEGIRSVNHLMEVKPIDPKQLLKEDLQISRLSELDLIAQSSFDKLKRLMETSPESQESVELIFDHLVSNFKKIITNDRDFAYDRVQDGSAEKMSQVQSYFGADLKHGVNRYIEHVESAFAEIFVLMTTRPDRCFADVTAGQPSSINLQLNKIMNLFGYISYFIEHVLAPSQPDLAAIQMNSEGNVMRRHRELWGGISVEPIDPRDETINRVIHTGVASDLVEYARKMQISRNMSNPEHRNRREKAGLMVSSELWTDILDRLAVNRFSSDEDHMSDLYWRSLRLIQWNFYHLRANLGDSERQVLHYAQSENPFYGGLSNRLKYEIGLIHKLSENMVLLGNLKSLVGRH